MAFAPFTDTPPFMLTGQITLFPPGAV